MNQYKKPVGQRLGLCPTGFCVSITVFLPLRAAHLPKFFIIQKTDISEMLWKYPPFWYLLDNIPAEKIFVFVGNVIS